MRHHLNEQAARIAGIDPRASRWRSPGDIVARMKPRFAEFGITRLADITGLDTIGWPVWAAIRPNAPTLSVSQGKGSTPAAAQASAIMEAVEITAAERARASCVASAASLSSKGHTVDTLGGLVRRGQSVPIEHESIGWIRGHDLLRDQDVWVPAQAIAIDATDPHRTYWQSSDGLGSGNLMIEAVLHGLCERIERDAGEFWLLRSDREVAQACIDPYRLGSPEVSGLAEAITKADLHLRLFDITGDVGVPVYFATVSPIPDGTETGWFHFDLASGMGCRPNPVPAAMAAIGEALQSRLTTISGARDDFQPAVYRQRIASDILIYPRCRPEGAKPRVAPPKIEIRDALDMLLGRLKAASVDSVIVVPLQEDADYAVAKVIVPGLEHPPGARAVAHGARILRAMGQRS